MGKLQYLTFALPVGVTKEEAEEVKQRLVYLAVGMGYLCQSGPLAGFGSPGRLLLGLGRGDILAIRMSREDRLRFADTLERLRHRDETGLFERVAHAIRAFDAIYQMEEVSDGNRRHSSEAGAG